MNELLHHIDHINRISRKILTRIDSSGHQQSANHSENYYIGAEQVTESSEYDILEDLLASRRERIDAMQNSIDNLAPSVLQNLSDTDRSTLHHKFEDFKKIHEQTEAVLNAKMDGQKEQLGGASNLRKAEEKYHILGEPDISYFSER